MRKKEILFSLFLGLMVSSLSFALDSNLSPTTWENLSDKDISPSGKKALALSEEWLHAESTHFVYHFTDLKSADTILVHAETYYDWIKKLFGIENDTWTKKSHVFIFENKDIWQNYVKKEAPVLEGTAFTTGWELFMYRDPYWLSPMRTIAHELTHVIAFRFLDGPIPLFLNEGLAEYVSYKALALQFGGNEYNVHTLKLIPEEKYIPLEELVNLKNYPESSEKVALFYQESELLVRFLMTQKGGEVFYAFLKKVSSGIPLEETLQEIYALDLNALEQKFKSFAIQS